MIAIERILCPIDLSDDSERTVRYAVALARACEAKLFICHRPGSTAPDSSANAVNLIKALVRAALTRSSNGQGQESAIDWETIILERDDIGGAITEAAAEQAAELVLMRSRRRPFAATLLGSTAETVARQAPCSVLVMHADEREWMDRTGEIVLKQVLVALDNLFPVRPGVWFGARSTIPIRGSSSSCITSAGLRA